MSFLVNEKLENIISKYSEIWNRTQKLIGKYLDVEVIHKNIYITTKVKSYKNEIKTVFHDEGLPQEPASCLTYSLMLIDSVFKCGKNYYPQALLEECKYIV